MTMVMWESQPPTAAQVVRPPSAPARLEPQDTLMSAVGPLTISNWRPVREASSLTMAVTLGPESLTVMGPAQGFHRYPRSAKSEGLPPMAGVAAGVATAGRAAARVAAGGAGTVVGGVVVGVVVVGGTVVAVVATTGSATELVRSATGWDGTTTWWAATAPRGPAHPVATATPSTSADAAINAMM